MVKGRGWVFEKQAKKNTRERINEIVENHKKQSSIFKSYNVINYSEKNSIALAYLS
jgi:hypothetical protein